MSIILQQHQDFLEAKFLSSLNKRLSTTRAQLLVDTIVPTLQNALSQLLRCLWPVYLKSPTVLL